MAQHGKKSQKLSAMGYCDLSVYLKVLSSLVTTSKKKLNSGTAAKLIEFNQRWQNLLWELSKPSLTLSSIMPMMVANVSFALMDARTSLPETELKSTLLEKEAITLLQEIASLLYQWERQRKKPTST